MNNFGADAVAVYSIDTGRLVTTVVGSRPDTLALSPNQHFLLAADALAGDVAVILKRDKTTKANPAPFALHTLVPVGIQPNQIAVKAFIAQEPGPKPRLTQSASWFSLCYSEPKCKSSNRSRWRR